MRQWILSLESDSTVGTEPCVRVAEKYDGLLAQSTNLDGSYEGFRQNHCFRFAMKVQKFRLDQDTWSSEKVLYQENFLNCKLIKEKSEKEVKQRQDGKLKKIAILPNRFTFE